MISMKEAEKISGKYLKLDSGGKVEELRRYLIDYGFLERRPGGSAYRRR